MVIPRTAIFLRRGEYYLLLRGSPSKRLWAGKYNGLGGHVERGENVMLAAARELREESGLEADLWLCGTVLIDAGEVGVCLFVFTGESAGGELKPSKEGIPEWIEYGRIGTLPAVEDLPVLLERIHRMRRGDVPFSAHSLYDEQQLLRMEFAD
ncbi:MAG TPA: NUDIX domain-containing protein [Anaerolineales bacterium]